MSVFMAAFNIKIRKYTDEEMKKIEADDAKMEEAELKFEQ